MPLSLEPTSLQILCDALGDGVILFDGEDRMTFVNDGACRLLSRTGEELIGLSSHNVFVGHLGAPPSVLSRLRAGEVVSCDGPDGTVGAFRAQWVRLPSKHEDDTPTALVIQDQRLGHALRRVEDALMRVHMQDGLVSNPSQTRALPLSHMEVMRYLSREVRRSHRDGQELSTVLVRTSKRVDARLVAGQLARTLRGNDRAGILRATQQDDDAYASDEVTMASFDIPLPASSAWFLLVLPCTPTTGAHALVMRLRALLGGEVGLSPLALGVSSLSPRREEWQGPRVPADCAQSLLSRAHAACMTERHQRDEAGEIQVTAA